MIFSLLHKRAFTLVELIVYILISSIVILIAGRVWYDTTRQAHDTRGLLSAGADADEVFLYLKEDIARLGAKISLVADTIDPINDLAFWKHTPAPVSDSSSFHLGSSGTLDTLVFKATNYESDGSMLTYDSIAYFVNADDQLLKNLTLCNIASSCASPTVTTSIIMDGVSLFAVEAGVAEDTTGAYTLDSVRSNMVYTTGPAFSISDPAGSPFSSANNDYDNIDMALLMGFTSTSSHLVQFKPNIASSSEATFNLDKGATYALEFYTRNNATFSTSFDETDTTAPADTLRAMVLDASGNKISGIPYFFFYPGGAEDNYRRYFEFSPASAISGARFRLSIHLENTNVADSFYIGSIYIRKVSLAAYDWRTSFNEADADDVHDKSNVRALKVRLRVEKGDRAYQGADSTLFREYEKIIAVPNNGLST